MRPPDDDSDKSEKSKIIKFPGGKSVNPAGLGAPYVIGPSAHIPTPDIIDPLEIEQQLRERTDYVRKQDLVRATSEQASTAELIDIILKEIAEESAHVKYERRELSKQGKSTINHTMQRVAMLKQLAETLLKRKEADIASQLDLKSPRVQKMLQLWLEFIYAAMQQSGINEETIVVVLQTMKAGMLGWEQKISEIV